MKDIWVRTYKNGRKDETPLYFERYKIPDNKIIGISLSSAYKDEEVWELAGITFIDIKLKDYEIVKLKLLGIL